MINYEFPPIGGGTGNACYYMLREFSSYPDLEIDLVTFSPDNRTRTEKLSEHITIHYVKCGRKQALHHWTMGELARWLVLTWWYLRRHLSRQQYDLIHCWSGWPAGILGYVFRRQTPYMVALRGSDVPGHTPRTAWLDRLVMRRLSRRVWGQAAAVTALSNQHALLAMKTIVLEYNIVYNGIDKAEFYPLQKNNIQYPIKILFVGRLTPHKGIMDLLNGIKLFSNEYGANAKMVTHFTIVGSGKLFDNIREFVQNRNLSDLVSLKGGLPHETLPSIYREHDIFISPSHSEALGNVILEATASGLAIICTQTGGAEIVDGNGLIINKKHPTDINSALQELVSNPSRLQTYKETSAALSTKLGWDSCCIKYQKIYNNIIKPCTRRES